MKLKISIHTFGSSPVLEFLVLNYSKYFFLFFLKFVLKIDILNCLIASTA